LEKFLPRDIFTSFCFTEGAKYLVPNDKPFWKIEPFRKAAFSQLAKKCGFNVEEEKRNI